MIDSDKAPMRTKTYRSDLSGESVEYLLIDMLPSGFRSYDQKEIYVRGLYFEESLALSKYVGKIPEKEVNYSQIVSIYSDCIKGISITDLEPIDLKVLIIISSIWTVDNFGWTPNVSCPQEKVPNQEYIDLKKKIEESQDIPAEDLAKLQDTLLEMEEYIPCDGTINELITLEDFDFDEPNIKDLPINLKIKNVDYEIGPLTVGDKISKEIYIKENPDIDPIIVDYAVLIKNRDMSLDDKIKVIRYGDRSVYKLSDIDSDLLINTAPIDKPCSKCKMTSKLFIGLNEVRGFP